MLKHLRQQSSLVSLTGSCVFIANTLIVQLLSPLSSLTLPCTRSVSVMLTPFLSAQMASAAGVAATITPGTKCVLTRCRSASMSRCCCRCCCCCCCCFALASTDRSFRTPALPACDSPQLVWNHCLTFQFNTMWRPRPGIHRLTALQGAARLLPPRNLWRGFKFWCQGRRPQPSNTSRRPCHLSAHSSASVCVCVCKVK